MPRRCQSRHRKSWAIPRTNFGPMKCLLWCYECGAIRDVKDTRWIYPTGPNGENPYEQSAEYKAFQRSDHA